MSEVIVEVLDKICGSGKTTALLKWCADNDHHRYIYVTPSLEEAQNRVFEVCPSLDWKCPTNLEEETKSEDLIRLLQDGRNISCTHNLFLKMDREALYYLNKGKYTLILDEELETIEPLSKYSKSDRLWLFENKCIDIEEDTGKVKWINEIPVGNNHSYKYMKYLCDNGLLYASKRDMDMMVVQVPIEVITSSYRVVISTYLFEGSVMDCFIKRHGVIVKPFTDVSIDDSRKLAEISSLITFVGEKQVSSITGSLSSGWYEDKMTDKDAKKIANLIYQVAWGSGCTSKDVLYTFPKSRVEGKQVCIKPRKYKASECWLSCTSRATNKYKDRTLMIHAYNRFPHLVVSSYLHDAGFPINQDRYALAELVQWVWRSAIRDGHPIKLCIVSKRMKKIFMSWLSPDDQSVTS